MAVRYLTQVRMIRRERERGSRRDVYVVMDDAWHDMLMQHDQIYAPILAALVAARGALGEATRAGERMQLSVEFLEFVHPRDGRHRASAGSSTRPPAADGIRPRAGDAVGGRAMPERGPARHGIRVELVA